MNAMARTNSDHFDNNSSNINNSNNNIHSSGPLKKRKRNNPSPEENNASKTQNDILTILQTLEDYCNGSNKANFLDFEHIPKLLLGVVGSHCETDAQACILAAQGIVQYATGTAHGLGNVTNTNRNNLRRRAILPEIFGKALRSGGTEHSLQAIQKLGLGYWNGQDTTDTVRLNDTLVHCWKVVLCGIRAGLSKRLLLLIAQACLADLDEIDAFTEERAMEGHFEVLSGILKVISEAITELPREAIASERHAILRACLSLLSRACMSGVENANGEKNIHNNRTNSDDDTKALSVIEDILGILVVCAQKGLLLRGDYERLVPACSASLSRFVLSSKGKTNDAANDDDDDMTRSIPIRVVQLIEAEDATIGLWLRQTYGIPPPHLIGNVHRPLQDSLLSMMVRQKDSNAMPFIPNTTMHSPPLALPPPAPPRHTFRSILVAAPDSDESSSDEEDEGCWHDHDEEDENQDDTEEGKDNEEEEKTVIDNGK